MFEKLRGVDKKRLSKFLAVIAMIAFSSFLIERFGFGHALDSLEGVDKGISTVENSDIVADNFVLDEKGEFVSQSENASLAIATKGRYIYDLELNFSGEPNYYVLVRYVDPKNNEEVVLENRLRSSMKKSKLNFLDSAIYNIQNSPEKIIIQAPDAGIRISGIRIDNSYRFNIHRFIFVFAVGLLVLVLFVLRKRIGNEPEYAFFAVALICGSLIAFSEPRSYVSWDELAHYKIADKVALKDVIRKNVDDIYSSTNSVPFSYSFHEQERLDEYFDNDDKKETKKKKKDSDFSLLDSYNRLGHIPSGAALALGRLIHLPGHMIFVFGRWMNVFIFSLVVFFAIRKLKTGKMIMSLVALLPTSIFLASNYGYDPWVIAFTLLGSAYVFSGLQQPEKKMGAREAAIMIGAFVVGLGPKAIYFPLMFMMYLLRSAKFENLKQYRYFLSAVTLSILLVVGSFMLPFIILGPGDGDGRGGKEVDSTKQVAFILSEPVTYAKILVSFIKDYINPMNAGGLVTSFAYLGSIKGFMLVLVALLATTFLDKNEYDKKTMTLRVRLLIIGIYLATVSLVSTALYVAFTPVGSEVIAGVQPRYLIPLIFPLLSIIGSRRIKNPISRNIYNLVIFGIMAIVLMQGIWDLVVSKHY